MKLLVLLFALFLPFYLVSQDLMALKDQVSSLYEKGESKKAIPIAEKARQLAAKTYGSRHANYAYFLNVLGILYADTGEYQKAEPLYKEAADIYKTTAGISHPNYVGALDNLASVYTNLGDYAKAESLYLQVKESIKKNPGPTHWEYAKLLGDLGLLYHRKGEMKKAEQTYLEGLSVWENGRNEQGRDYATSLGNLAAVYLEIGLYAKAEPVLIKANKVFKRTINIDHPAYGNNLNTLGVLYSKMGKFKESEQYYLEAGSIVKKFYGENSMDFSVNLGNMARLYGEMGQFKKAEEFSLKEIALLQKLYGEGHSDYANSLSTLGVMYNETNQPQKAQPLLLKAKEIFERNKDPQHAYALNNLAALYINLGQFEKAEQLYVEANQINQRLFGSNDHILYANTLNNLAQFYAEINQMDKAIETMKKSIDLKRKLLGENHPDYAIALDNLASIYLQQDDYKNAAPLSVQAAQIREKTLGPDHPLYARSLHTVAMVYQKSGDYRKAEELLLRYSAIMKANFGEKNADYSTSLNDLGVFYFSIGYLDKSESYLLKAAEIGKLTQGEKHPEYATQLDNLAKLYFLKNDFPKAASYSMASNQIFLDNARRTFASLSDKEKTVFLESRFDKFQFANNILDKSKNPDPNFKQSIFNHLLMLKSLALSDTKDMFTSIRKGKDNDLKNLLEKWEDNKRMLSRQYAMPADRRISNLKEFETQTDELEKQLNRRSTEYREQQSGMNITFQDIQKRLSADEVAIDFVYYRQFDKKWTDKIKYAAYILKKNDATPIFVPLCNEQDLNGILKKTRASNSREMVNKLYRGGKESTAAMSSASVLGDSLYKLIWQPLEVHLGGIKKVNLVPAGKLFSIAFQALPTSKDELLIDRYVVEQFTSTRELALDKKNLGKPLGIAMFGDAKFTMSGPGTGSGYKWSDLPGTANEVNNIEKLFQQNRIPTVKYLGQSASESNFKKISGNSPEIIHMATHGFFLPIQYSSNENSSGIEQYSSSTEPLLRNGLLLAGANNSWSNNLLLPGAEDGIVTAYEISQLDLTNTKLVVLSACETALGDVQGTEGVFGLQRSFKMAGVDKLILSLWQVPDKETAELMTMFYQNWLSGLPIRQSFNAAQAEMRKKYTPYFWAAFVLID